MKNLLLIITLFSLIFISCESEEKKEAKPQGDPKEYFLKANSSSMNVKDATFKVKFIFQSPKENFNINGSFSLLRDENSKLGYIVKFIMDEGEGLYTGDKYYFRSVSEKKVFVTGDDIEPEMFITQNWIYQPISMIMLDRDYSKEILERKDDLYIIGEAKYNKYNTMVVETIIKIDSVTRNKTRTHFDLETNLPLKEVKSIAKMTENIIQTFEIYDLEINKGLDKSIFKMDVPEGYTEQVISPQSSPEPESAGGPAPDFTLKDINGKDVTLSKLKGKVVVLDFWGTWCHWCVKAMPKLQAVHEHFKGKNVVVLGISCNERPGADPKKFMVENKVTYNSLVEGNEVATKYSVQGFPTLYVIGKDGNILSMKSGYAENMDKDLINLIKKNL